MDCTYGISFVWERFPCLYFSLLLHIAKPTSRVFEQYKTNIQEAYACIATHAFCIWNLHSIPGHTSIFVEYNRLGLIRPMTDVLAHEWLKFWLVASSDFTHNPMDSQAWYYVWWIVYRELGSLGTAGSPRSPFLA